MQREYLQTRVDFLGNFGIFARSFIAGRIGIRTQ